MADSLDRSEAARRGAEAAKARGVEYSGRPSTLPADVEERIVAAYRGGTSLKAIARDLNEAGVPTGRGGSQWWPSSVRSVLARLGELPA